MSGESNWLEVELPSEAFKLALYDLGEVAVSPSAHWLDKSGDSTTLYVLALGSLHRLTGRPDATPGATSANPPEPTPSVSRCEYHSVPITGDSTFSLMVTSQSVVVRKWTFEVGDSRFEVEVTSPSTASEDASPFARSLAREIVRAQARSTSAGDA
jgi:hypothetical protein